MSEIGMRYNQPFMIGVLLAVNAIRDAYAIINGPHCLIWKTDMIRGPHDQFSTLGGASDAGRVRSTLIDPAGIADDCEDRFLGMLNGAGRAGSCGVVVASAMPMCTIAGVDQERLVEEARQSSDKPILDVPGRSLSSDWNDGYELVLSQLAEQLDLSGADPVAGNVAVVGYFMDRNEGDHLGNLAALKDMLRALDLDPVSIWLSGEPVEHLRRARHAETIISLPHGRHAAEILSERTGAKLVHTDLPFGLAGTTQWLQRVAAATDREERAERYRQAELDRVIPRLAWTVQSRFLNHRIAYFGSPYFADPLIALLEEVGASVPTAAFAGQERPLRCNFPFEPTEQQLRLIWQNAGEVDLVVADGFAAEILGLTQRWVEWGYPSLQTHFLRDEPFLGYQGCLAFLSRLANAISHGYPRTMPRRERPLCAV